MSSATDLHTPTRLRQLLLPGLRAPRAPRAAPTPHALQRAADDLDPMAQMAQADAADASLMRLVLCAAGATLLLALVSSLA